MTRAIVLASVLLAGGAVFGVSGGAASADEAKSADAMKKERCERNAMLMLYTGRQKTKYIRECLAHEEAPEGEAAKRQPSVHPSGPTAMPRPEPLGGANRPSISTDGTTPSNAPVAPSAPVVGSTGTSITGSSATSTSGSSATSIGSSGGGR